MKKIIKNIYVILVLILVLLTTNANIIYATTQIKEAYLVKIGDADYHLKYYNSKKGMNTYIKVSIVGYYNNNTFYPAYCSNKDLEGVGDIGSYYVDTASIYNNDRVWRAIKNGYPYKNAKDLGLSSDWNAYAVTKMAVYCLLGQSDINLFSVDENDKEAVNMLKALKDLVNIGIYGNESYSNNVKFEKNNNLIEEENYYFQEYKIVSNVEISKYTIKNINGFPDGSLITDEKGNVKTTFNSNEKVKVKIPKTKMNKDIEGTISIETEIKDHKMYDGKARISGAQDCIVTSDSYSTVNNIINFTEKLDKGKIIINKTDKETKQGIKDTEFEIYDLNRNKIKEGKTNEFGILEFSNLYQGKYIIKEKKANENYIINDKEYEVEVKYNKTHEINISNEHKKGNLKIYKRDKENDRISLGNVEFDLYSYESDKIIGTYFTDVNGEIYIENIRIGNYKLIEKKTNKWYDLAGDTEIVVKWKDTGENIVYNELKKGQIKIIKQDKDNSEIRLQGVKFNIINSKGEIVEELITNENGEAISKGLPINEKYTVKEVETLKDYILNEQEIEVTLESKEVREILFENEKIKSKIKIIKQDSDNENVKLQGVTFNIFNSKGELLEELITDENGEAVSKFLPVNEKYIIKEISTQEGYVLNETPIEVLLDNKEENELIIKNEKIKSQIKIIKQDSEDNNVYLQGVRFNILNSRGEIIQELITNENGEAVSEKLPINEEYTIVEFSTLDNYVLNNIPINIKLESDEIKELVIKNQKIKGQIEIVKTSSEDNKITGEKKGSFLSDVKFEIYDSNGNVVDTIVTDAEGRAISCEVEKGKYKIKEIATNKNYILNSEIYTVDIETNGQIVRLEITNDPMNPDINIEKYGPNEANIGEEIKYDITIKNTGNTELQNFKWIDTIDTKYLKITYFETGTYNQKNNYNIYYKTNLSNGEYILLMEDLNTYENHKIDFIKEISDNEYVTEIVLDFGKVNIGFSSNEKAIIGAVVQENVKSEDTFINEVKISGEYNGYLVEDSSKWKTIAYKILPNTGF